MSEELRALTAFACAASVALVATPVAIRVAGRTGFLDRPEGYKAHSRVTPYLGGAAVIASFVISAALLGEGLSSAFALVLVVAAFLAVVGTIDDRIHLGIGIRVVAQLGAAMALWLDGIRWEPTGLASLDLAISVVWVVGIVNAFNLLDNIDGATGATAATSAAGIGVYALIEGATVPGLAAFALSGACVGFLRFNLAQPSRIFLGDGGSLPIGFLLAAMAMMVPAAGGSLVALLAAVPLVGVAVFDTTLVVISRRRRGEPVLTGGRDHLTHRLMTVMSGPRAVAVLLVGVQGMLCALGILISGLPEAAAAFIAAGYSAAGVALLVRMETPPFRPRSRPVEQPV